MRTRILIALAMLGVSFTTTGADGQTPTQLLDRGLRAYQDLDYATAASLLQQAAAQLQPNTPNFDRTLSFLAASYVFLGNPDSATSVFTRLLIADPRYRIDQLTFPPEVWVGFETVRRDVQAVAVEIPPQTSLPLGRAALTAKAFVTSRHFVTIDILSGIGGHLTTLYRGPIADSLEIRWNPRDAAGNALAGGDYVLAVTSQDSTRRPVRVVRIPLELRAVGADTLEHPPAPGDSLFLPERDARTKPRWALLRGFAAGAAVLIGPSIVTSSSSITGGRVAVSLAAAFVGILGATSPPLGKPLPDNVEANRALVTAWENEVARIADENQRRLENARLVIRAGTPTLTEPGRP